jgi:hypothetical protein
MAIDEQTAAMDEMTAAVGRLIERVNVLLSQQQAGVLSVHNESSQSHQDIRNKITTCENNITTIQADIKPITSAQIKQLADTILVDEEDRTSWARDDYVAWSV